MFFNKAELDDLMALLKLSLEIPPTEGVFIGLKFTNETQVNKYGAHFDLSLVQVNFGKIISQIATICFCVETNIFVISSAVCFKMGAWQTCCISGC